MKHLLRIWLAIFAASAITLTFAAGTTANLSWIPPTTYTDGTPIAPGDIDHYVITWSPGADQAGPASSVNVAGNLSATKINIACGTTSFTIATVTSSTAKYPNTASTPTSPVPYASGITCTPNPPSGLVAQ